MRIIKLWNALKCSRDLCWIHNRH